jgi:hypothetical protein
MSAATCQFPTLRAGNVIAILQTGIPVARIELLGARFVALEV